MSRSLVIMSVRWPLVILPVMDKTRWMNYIDWEVPFLYHVKVFKYQALLLIIFNLCQICLLISFWLGLKILTFVYLKKMK